MSEKNTNLEPGPDDLRSQHVQSYKSNKQRPRLIPRTSEIERGGPRDFGVGGRR